MTGTRISIPFNRPFVTEESTAYVIDALQSGKHCGNGSYADRCRELLRERYGFDDVFLTPSCTSALEFGALLADLQPGDEVVLPSYTFSSTVNAVVLRGAVPIFCEVSPDTMNMDPLAAEALISPRTRMLLPIDYAGIPSDGNRFRAMAEEHDLILMQDAAQSLHSFCEGVPAGSHADLAAFSFHETKNFNCGEGGALLVNRPEWVERAHVLQEKGTDRRRVLLGLQNKYSWVDTGSSFLLGDVLAAMLLGQLEAAETITSLRRRITAAYRELYQPYELRECLRIPHAPQDSALNHHAFFVLFDSSGARRTFIEELKDRGVWAYIGYVPLHSSPMGRRLGYQAEDLPVTEDLSGRIVRLPVYPGLAEDGLEYCLDAMAEVLGLIYDN